MAPLALASLVAFSRTGGEVDNGDNVVNTTRVPDPTTPDPAVTGWTSAAGEATFMLETPVPATPPEILDAVTATQRRLEGVMAGI